MSLVWEGEMDFIRGDRRAHRRYPADLPVQYRMISKGKDPGAPAWGRVNDLSSSGTLFTAGKPIARGTVLQLIMDWPAPGSDPMQLVLVGKVVRSSGTMVAVRTTQREFRHCAALATATV